MVTGTLPILVVEDESDIRELIALHLKRAGYQVEECGSAEDASRSIQTNQFQLLILDWMLPGMSGVELTQHLRRNSVTAELPILMLTAKADPNDIVAGLESGADDYITKPFEPSVLIARVTALIRRSLKISAVSPEPSAESSLLHLGAITVNLDSHQTTLRGEEIHLTPSEFKLLVALIQNKGRVLTRSRLILLVQGEGISVVDRVVDTLVFGLRKKLGDQGDLVETVRGVGYRVGSGEPEK